MDDTKTVWNTRGPVPTNAPASDDLVRAWRHLDRPGAKCQQCGMGGTRRPTHVRAIDGEMRALCDDCAGQIEMDQLHQRHVVGTR
jgi:hypothetical protein